MSRERKRRPLTVWSRKYLQPTQQAAELHNLRAYFIKCIERCTPEVVEELGRQVLPHYRLAFWAEVEQNNMSMQLYMDKRAEHHREMAAALANSSAPNNRWRSYESVREHLSTWADRHNLRVEWVFQFALDALLEWTIRNVRFRRSPVSVEDIKFKGFRSLTSAERDAIEDALLGVDETARTWSVRSLAPEDYIRLLPPTTRNFEYPSWENFDGDPGLYRLIIERLFAEHLEQYLDEIQAQIPSFATSSSITKPEQFEMLALSACRNCPAAALEERFHKDASVIRRDIKAAAKRIGFPIRRPGRPRKSRD